MVVVRFIALAALVVWLAGMMPLVFGDAFGGAYLPAACGAVVLLSLTVIKFVGPPPRAFLVRAAIVGGMLILTALALVSRVPAWIAVRVNLALGVILLIWYAHE